MSGKTLESEGMEGSPVDMAKVRVAEAVSWLDEKKDEADGLVMDTGQGGGING